MCHRLVQRMTSSIAAMYITIPCLCHSRANQGVYASHAGRQCPLSWVPSSSRIAQCGNTLMMFSLLTNNSNQGLFIWVRYCHQEPPMPAYLWGNTELKVMLLKLCTSIWLSLKLKFGSGRLHLQSFVSFLHLYIFGGTCTVAFSCFWISYEH